MFDKRCRAGVERSLRPVGTGLKKIVTADQLTVLGLLLSIACAGAIAHGWLFVGWSLLPASAVPDVPAGALAQPSAPSSPPGALLPSHCPR